MVLTVEQQDQERSIRSKICRIFLIISLYTVSIFAIPIMENYGFSAVFEIFAMVFVAIFLSEMIVFLLLYILMALIAAAVISMFSGQYYSQVERYAMLFWFIACAVVMLGMWLGLIPYNENPRSYF